MLRETILIVDDMELNREILVEILKDEYDTLQAANGYEAIDLVMRNADKLSCVLLDIVMPEMDGIEVLNILQSGGYAERIPIIIITASGGDENEITCLKSGAVDFLSKPFHPEIVKCRVTAQISLKRYRNHMEELVDENVKKVTLVREAMIDVLASVIEYRHCESGQHVKRTRQLAEQLLKNIKLSGKMDNELSGINTALLTKAVPLHDVGKISIPDHILLKPGKLDPEEFEIIKTHTTLGEGIINTLVGIEDEEYLTLSRDICVHHHERWDGKGYPSGLSGKDIPFSARIMAIVDVYDALTSPRVYKPAFSKEEATGILLEGRGSHFDPIICDIFLDSLTTNTENDVE